MIPDARLRSWVLGQLLTLPISLVFVAVWQEPEGFYFVALAVFCVYVAPYLPLVLWLAYRVSGLARGWLAGLACAAAYPVVSAVGVWWSTSGAAAAWLCVLAPAAIVTLASRCAPVVALPATAWPRVLLGLLGAPVTAIAVSLACTTIRLG